MSVRPAVVVLDDVAEVAAEAARRCRALAREAIAARGRWSVALSGGQTPRALYRLLGDEPGAIEWSCVDVLFGDERCVPPTHPDSNYAMAKQALLARVPISPSRVHRMRGESDDPASAAAEYEADLRATLGPDGLLDLALMGMGSDGHTASLFPGDAALGERRRLCIAAFVPGLDAPRITLTYPLFENAREILFLVTGQDKAEALNAVLHGPRDPQRLPSQPIVHRDGDGDGDARRRQRPRRTPSVTILCDRAAACELPTT